MTVTKKAHRHKVGNLILAALWFTFGAVGLWDYVWGSGKIANSIPVLFAISVYANFVGHVSAAEAADDE